MKNFFTKNIGLKSFSLLLAILLELHFYSPDNSLSTVLPVPIEVQNLNPDMMVVWPILGERGKRFTTRVRLRGPAPQVKQLASAGLKFIVELPEQNPYDLSVKLSPEQLRLPQGIEVEEIEPPAIDLKLERVMDREFVVVVDRVGEPPTGHRIEKVRSIPETVLARGPRGEIADGLSVVKTHPVDVSKLTQTKTIQAQPLVERGPLSKFNVPAVSVEVVVSVIMDEREYSQVTPSVLAPAGLAASVEPSRVRAKISGPKHLLQQLNAGDLQIIADGQAFKPGKYMVDLKANLPEGVELISLEPAQVNMIVVAKTAGSE